MATVSYIGLKVKITLQFGQIIYKIIIFCPYQCWGFVQYIILLRLCKSSKLCLRMSRKFVLNVEKFLKVISILGFCFINILKVTRQFCVLKLTDHNYFNLIIQRHLFPLRVGFHKMPLGDIITSHKVLMEMIEVVPPLINTILSRCFIFSSWAKLWRDEAKFLPHDRFI